MTVTQGANINYKAFEHTRDLNSRPELETKRKTHKIVQILDGKKMLQFSYKKRLMGLPVWKE